MKIKTQNRLISIYTNNGTPDSPVFIPPSTSLQPSTFSAIILFPFSLVPSEFEVNNQTLHDVMKEQEQTRWKISLSQNGNTGKIRTKK